ncbi:MAG: glycosyltransferase [Cyclobacteriaceae bacterium]
MSRKEVAIVSLLKPVNDVRSYEKMARSLASEGFCVTLIGSNNSKNILKPKEENISFQSLPHFKPLSLERFLMPWIVFRELSKLKPELAIVNTSELLIVVLLNQILFGGKIVYDIQENYFRNFIYQNNYPPILKHLLGFSVRLKEKLLSPFIDHFILAEHGYIDEFSFFRSKYTVIENKAVTMNQRETSSKGSKCFKFLFSGNISDNSGVKRALDFFKAIAKEIPEIKLTIIGHCPNERFLNKLKEKCTEDIELIASIHPIDHTTILKQIQDSDFGIVSYNVNPSNENCMPTKVFEYLAYGLPIISQTRTKWTEYALKHKACISVEYENFNTNIVAASIMNFDKSSMNHHGKFTWDIESKKLIELIGPYLNK